MQLENGSVGEQNDHANPSNRNANEGGDNNDENANLSQIMLDKERIRSLITPNPDARDRELLGVDSKKQFVANN